MARRLALVGALVAALLPVSGAGGTEAQRPKRGGTLNIVMAIEPPCVSPIVDPCQNLVLPIRGVVEGAFKQRPDWSWEPRLVSGVDVTRKPPFTLTYHIRPEARWSDGRPVTSRDFLFTHAARLKHPDPAELHKTWIRGSPRALDSKTVRVRLRSRFGFWQYLFTAVFPEHALRGEDLADVWEEEIDNPKTGQAIGNGPWLMESWQRGEQLTLVRNPRYWGRHTSYLDRIVVRFSFDATAAGLFATGRADVGQWQFDPALASALRAVRGVRLRFSPTPVGFEHLDMRIGPGGHPALRGTQGKLVRRALAYAIDRVAIVRAVVGTDVEPNPRPRDSLVYTVGSRSYKPNWSGYRYRPDEARRLLARAGCQLGADGIFSCAGERLALRFVSRGVIARRVQTLELVQLQARRAGIEVIPVYTSGAGHDQVLATGDFDVTLFAWFGAGADAGDMDTLYGCGGSQNHIGYCQRLLTRDLDQADRIVDSGRRARLLNQVDVRLAQDVPSIPLFEVRGLAAVTPAVRGFLPTFFFFDPTWNAENWWLER